MDAQAVRCPECESKAQVLETREMDTYTRRRYGCACGFRFTTREVFTVSRVSKPKEKKEINALWAFSGK